MRGKSYVKGIKTNYSREELLDICEKSFVLQVDWYNRDSASAQLGVGKAYALLKAGCGFDILITDDGRGCSTGEYVIWVQFYVHDFQFFEHGSEYFEDKRGNAGHEYHIYLPTKKRLREANGKDWY